MTGERAFDDAATRHGQPDSWGECGGGGGVDARRDLGAADTVAGRPHLLHYIQVRVPHHGAGLWLRAAHHHHGANDSVHRRRLLRSQKYERMLLSQRHSRLSLFPAAACLPPWRIPFKTGQ